MNRNHLFIGISSAALIAVLVIQVSWLLRTARAKEELFNEKAAMVLTRTAEALSLDSIACNNLRLQGNQNEKEKIDSLFKYYMKLYNFKALYYFEVSQGTETTQTLNPFLPANNTYKACVDDQSGKNGIELKLLVPDKQRFILEEMSLLFVASIILIIIVLVLFWRTTLLLLKEKKLSQQTTDLLNNMTHEFKTPLTNIALATKMIMKEMPEQSEKLKHYTGILLSEQERLKQQVELTLSMTALEKGEIPLAQSSVDMHQLIQQVLMGFKIQFEASNAILRTQLKAQHHTITGDRLHLQIALNNLIDNALKYSGINPEITIETYNNNHTLVIKISDNGIGIDTAYHQHIFEKFYRVPMGNVHDVKGFGLGLTYTKKITELHKGHIEVMSEPKKGATFIISLPYA